MRVHIGKRTDSRTDGRGSGQPDLGSTSRRGRRQALEEQQPRPRGGGRRRRATISSARAVMQQQRTERGASAHGARTYSSGLVAPRKENATTTCAICTLTCACVLVRPRYILKKERGLKREVNGDVDKGGRRPPIATSAVCVGEMVIRDD